MEYLREDDLISHKILFTGLDAAGKTSIILTLQREFSRINMVKPTRGAQRHFFKFLDKEIREWDLGGQKSYRISYLKNPDKYFAGTESTIYVIDIQDNKRIPESLSYLTDVIKQFRKFNLTPPINIFFHKFDPFFEKNYNNNLNLLSFELMKQIKTITKYEKLSFFQTSIYNLPSLITAISHILLELYPKSNLISKTIEEFAGKLMCEGFILLDNNAFILGSYYKDDLTKELLLSSIPHFLSLNDHFQLDGLDNNKIHIVMNRFNYYFLFRDVPILGNGVPYYIFVLKSNSPWDLYFSRKDFNAFITIMKEMLQNIP
ncbi:MAG: hypothetical protein EU539_11330 [Promethearchaeota archaeon]|nr:MAG: hypothetical protein EU539_11330 [Candidatus Lokiarchaeota archaeon]